MKDLRLLEFAVALNRHRNFARAADSLGVTQPTFSRGIAALEASLGARLFERSTRRVDPTPVGRVLLERAESLLLEAKGLSDLATLESGALSGQLIVASGPYPLECSVLRAVARIARQHPQLRIRVIEGAWRELPGALLQGSVDLLVMETSILADDHRLQVEALPRHPGSLLCRADHPLTRLPRVRLEDLEPYPLVGVPITREIGPQIGRARRLMNIDHASGDLTPHIVTTSLHAMREIVLRTDGVAIYPRTQLGDDLGKGRLATLKTDLELPSTGYGIATLRGRRQSPAALAFMQALRDVENEQIGGDGASSPVRSRPRKFGTRLRAGGGTGI